MRSWSPLVPVLIVLLASCRQPPKSAQTATVAGVAVGQVAPDIEGEDADSVRFRLSDYRGKVVALVFWATWCAPCRAMLPHERALAERLRDQPFALLSVNADDDRDRLRHFLATHGVTWRQWCDGGADGPIAQRYQVQSWPTVYVLDGRGVVRYRDVRGPELEHAVETLLREQQAERH